jgi:uncharacterized delta-60 repeat protein
MKGSRKLQMVAIGAMLGLLAMAIAAGASAARSRAGLDLAWGRKGVVSTQLTTKPAGYLSRTAFATAPDGSSYQLNSFRECGAVECTTRVALLRWTPDGTADTGFGGAGFVQTSSVSFRLEPRAEGTSLTVDSRGRPLVSSIERGAVVVRRYSPGGVLDTSFGSGGSISLSCGECERSQVWLLAASRGRSLVEVQNTLPAPEGGLGSALGGQVALTRLTAGGRPERHFGGTGTVKIELGLRGYPGKGAVTPKGGVLLGSVGCCSGTAPYLLRVSSKGRIDTKFGRAAGRSLARLSRRGETSNVVALVPRANGMVDLLGDNSIASGFDLRLKANGDRARFGNGGLRRLPFLVEAAALGSGGAIFAVGAQDAGSYSAFRLLSNGSVDPAFGRGGIPVPLSGSGFTLGTPSRGKVLVFDAGYHECRSGCPSTPGIARFDEGASKG